MSSASKSIISIRNLSKRFGATQALSEVSFEVNSHEVLALLGANGAGKSTVIKILAKIYSADSGEIVTPNKASIDEIKFSFIHQDLGLVEWMTVGESVALGSEYPRKNGLISWSGVREMATEALKNVAPHIDVNETISGLSRADRSLVAIARALFAKCDVLVLDEPTASLPAADCEHLFSVLRKLKAEGVAIVYVSHRLDEIFKVADRVVVLRDGKKVEDGLINSFDPSGLVKAIVGRETANFNLGETKKGEISLKVEGLSGDNVKSASFELRKGEVLGLIGLNGAGQREVGRMISGALPIHGGKVFLDGKPLEHDLASVVLQGISLITSSRAEEGLAMGLTVRENVFPNLRARGMKAFNWIKPKAEISKARELTERFNVKPRETELAVATLSGGNQQKVILARWLSIARSIVVLEEPTAGVDVGAKGDIYRLIDESSRNNLSVLLVSTDFEEVALMAHRALVFSNGEIVAELNRKEITVENLVTYASRANVGN